VVKARRTTIYISDKVDTGLVFLKDGRVEAFVKKDFNRATIGIRQDPDAVLLFDGDGDGIVRQPPIAPATMVLLTSPKRRRYK
jgi:hypothetical protein